MKLIIALMLLGCFTVCSQSQSAAISQPQPQRAKIVRHQTANGRYVATVFTYGHTPLQEAIRLINGEYGWAVHYEDAPTVNATEIIDGDATFRASHPGYNDGYFPNGQPFTTTIDESRPHRAVEATVLQQLVQDYNATSNPGRYSLQHTAQNTYVIVGTLYKSLVGVEVSSTPILGCPISIAFDSMSLYEALQLLAKKINSTCNASLDAQYAAEMVGHFADFNISGSYANEPARDVVESLLLQQPGLMYYSVDYVPVLNKYYLETWPLFRTTTEIDGREVSIPIYNNRVIRPGAHPF